MTLADHLCVNFDIMRNFSLLVLADLFLCLEYILSTFFNPLLGDLFLFNCIFIFSETMRHWPAALRLDRKCVKPYTLPPSHKSSTKEVKV